MQLSTDGKMRTVDAFVAPARRLQNSCSHPSKIYVVCPCTSQHHQQSTRVFSEAQQQGLLEPINAFQTEREFQRNLTVPS
jgi:hypothetical protein